MSYRPAARSPVHLSRRDFMAVAAATTASVTLAACGDDDGGSTGATAGDTEQYELIAAFPHQEPYLPTGSPQRLPFLLGIAGDAPLDRIDGPVPFTILDDSGEPVGDPIEVTPRGTGLPRAYLPLLTTFATPGFHTARATYRDQELEAAFLVSSPAEVTVPQVGQPLPPFATPVTTDHRGVEPICTRDPVCPFHEVDLTTALSAPGPTVLMISTPRYCQSNICGPVLDVLMEETSTRTGLSVVHAEVYANPEQVETIMEATPAPVVTAYGMSFEPSLFVADATGTITSRLDLIFDAGELSEALDAAA